MGYVLSHCLYPVLVLSPFQVCFWQIKMKLDFFPFHIAWPMWKTMLSS